MTYGVLGLLAFLLASLIYLPLTGFPVRRPGPGRIISHAVLSLACCALALAAVPDTPRLVLWAGCLAAFGTCTTFNLMRARSEPPQP